MGTLDGKVAIVAGASKGIGAGIAKSLAAEGAAITVDYASDHAGAENTVAAIMAAGGQAIAIRARVNNSADLTRLFDETNRAFGRFDILVNNAGVYSFTPITGLQESEVRRQFETNVFGLLFATSAALDHFSEGER
jgi:3-oxoacyl-[acyl-carrier protein] reductase